MAKKQTFQEAMTELEEISSWFSQEETDLDEGIKKFARGLELAAMCRSKLSEVENTVTKLKEQFATESDESGE
ncbi:exodeoxyribonuclease VII small subunit [Patescibacteria group bacterium]|jgi:exodeoxyribonuclease VII small subunit|nr:exodeoxyribonuclease VII small subunit [Patescibacteria group bacterium]